MAGVDFVIVNYHGSGPALPDLIGGQVQAMFDVVSSSISRIRAGRLRPLAVTTAARLNVLRISRQLAILYRGYGE